MSKYEDVDRIAEAMLKRGRRLSGVLRAVVAIENAREPKSERPKEKTSPEAETVRP